MVARLPAIHSPLVRRQSAVFNRVSDKELIFFTTQLALLMETGCSLTEALAALEPQIGNRALREAVHAVSLDVQGGRMLSTALAKHPTIFSNVYTSMVRAGEVGGFLVEMLQRLTQILKLKQGLISKVKSAMAYPAVLTLMSVGVVVFMITFVLPRFATLFEGKEAVLPLTTRMLIAMASFTVRWWPLILVGLLGLLVAVGWAIRSERGRLAIQRAVVSLPMIGPMCRLLYAARLLRTLGVMLESGIPLLDGVEVTRGTVGNCRFAEFLDVVEQNVKEGKNLSEPFSRSELFAPAVKQMVHTAELTGTTGSVMVKLADHYDEEVDVRLKALTSLLEPAIVVVMGSVVAFIAMSLFLPLFKISRGM